MILNTLTPDKLAPLKPLLEAFIAELGLGARTDADYVLNGMAASINARQASVFVDSVDAPGAFAWCLYNKGMLLNQTLCIVPIIFIRKDLRGNRDKVSHLMESIETAAKFNSCHSIYGGDWKALGVESAGPMWAKSGFFEQESFFVKHLT